MANFLQIKLANREKILVTCCGIFLFVALTSQLVVMPWFAERERLINGIASKKHDLHEMLSMQKKLTVSIENTHGIAKQLQVQAKKFTLFSYLEKAADENNVKQFITYMKPSVSNSKGPLKESLVEIKLVGVGLDRLSNYIKQIESPKDVVYLKRVSIQSSKNNKGTLDAILQVLTYTDSAIED